MTDVIVTFKLMPTSPGIDWETVKGKATNLIAGFGGEVGKSEVVPMAFGLEALMLYFVMDEEKGATDTLEEQVNDLEGVESVEVTDVRRALG